MKNRSATAAAAGRPGHIFNLGHGILPTTPVDTVWKATFDARGELGEWTPQASLFEATTDAAAALEQLRESDPQGVQEALRHLTLFGSPARSSSQ